MKLDEMLGFDAEDPQDRHAEILVEEHDNLLRSLVRLRESSGLTRQDVADSMGIDVSGVSRIESGDRDLHLSTLRRYAFACGAVVHHDVQQFSEVWKLEHAARVPASLTARAEWPSLAKLVRSVVV